MSGDYEIKYDEFGRAVDYESPPMDEEASLKERARHDEQRSAAKAKMHEDGKNIRDFSKLTGEDRGWLKAALTGQIRNVLANEFKVPSGRSSAEEVRNFLAADMENIVIDTMRKAFEGPENSGHFVKEIREVIRAEIKKAVRAEFAKNMAPRIKAACEGMKVSLDVKMDEDAAGEGYMGDF